MKKFAFVFGAASLCLLTACSPEPGSQGWCEQKAEQNKSDWTMDDASTYASHCLLDSTTIGSKEWCNDLKEKDKGDWTANEAADFAKHCVM